MIGLRPFRNRHFGDIRWFSERSTSDGYRDVKHALYAHIRYIAREREDLVHKEGLDWETWKQLSEQELGKRWDSRIAGKFCLALPNELSKEEAVKLIRGFVEQELKPFYYGFALHCSESSIEDGKRNFHAHIVFSARADDGRKLRLSRNHLRALQRKWDEHLHRYGFYIDKQKESRRGYTIVELQRDEVREEIRKHRAFLRAAAAPQPSAPAVVQERKKITAKREREARSASPKESLFKAFLNGFLSLFLRKEDDMSSKYVERSNQMINQYASLLHGDSTKVALLVVNSSTGERKQFVIEPEKLNPSLLRKLNAKGYNVYVSVNSLKEGAKSRKIEDFEDKQKVIYLDLDSKQKSPQDLLREIKNLGIPPSLIVKSSKGNFQVYWVLNERVEFERLQRIMVELENRLGIDHTHDVARVFRIPGLRNKKPNKDDWVTIPLNNRLVFGKDELTFTGKPYKVKVLEVFEEKLGLKQEQVKRERKQEQSQQMKAQQAEKPAVKESKKEREVFTEEEKELMREYSAYLFLRSFPSQSEADMAFTVYQISHGKDPALLKSFLRKLRWNKPNPEYYANLTVKKAIDYIEKQKQKKLEEEEQQRQKRLQEQQLQQNQELTQNFEQEDDENPHQNWFYGPGR